MATFQEKLDQAKKAGYSDQEVQDYIQKKTAEAKQAGYSDQDIQKFLGGSQPQQTPGVIDQLKSVAENYKNSPAYATSPQGMLQKGVEMGQQGINKLGEMGATGLASQGVNPYVAAGVGTAAQMTPDLMAAAESMKSVPEAAAGVESLLSKTGQGLKKVGNRIVQGPATEQIGNLRNQVSSMASQKAAKLAQLEELRSQAGTGIETARTAEGVPQKLSNLPSVGELDEAADFFKNKIGKMPADKLAQAYGKDGLMQLRDIAQKAKDSGVSSTQQAFINRGVANIDKALEKVAPKIAEGYKNYGTVQNAIEATPQDMMNKKIMLQNQIRNLQPQAGNEQALRQGAMKYGIPTGGALLYALKRLSGR